ncbi:MAG: helix-turn-helix transcriptional regulator [Vulcanimicrobiaceae bacterium]
MITVEKNENSAASIAASKELLRRRALPKLYVIDAHCRVVLSSDGIQLPDDVFDAVRELWHLRNSTGTASPRPFKLLDSSYAVRIAPLAGPMGEEFTAVFVERFQAREHLRGVSERYMLTRRESEVVALLMEGARTSEIADRLSIAQSTVILHIKSAMAKTSSRTRTEMLGRIVTNGADSVTPNPS